MRASFSPVENIYDLSVTPDEEKPLRPIHNRSQKAFDLNDARNLKNDIDQSFKNTIGKLTIFEQHDETAESIQLFARRLEPERPVTPPDDEVTIDSVPRDVDQLLALIRRRLNTQQVEVETTRLTSDDIAQLATVVLTQMRSKWMDIEEMRVQHPLISPKRNHELIRRLFVNIVLICTNIFEYTMEEAQVFHDRYVFSHAANMTRLRTLLADRINTLINIHSLREQLAFEMVEEERVKRGLIFEETILKNVRKRLSKTTVLSQHRPDIRDLIEYAGKSYKYEIRDSKYTSRQILHQLVTNMPDLNRFRRLPTVLPPIMNREVDSPTRSKKPLSSTKTIKQKSSVKTFKTTLERGNCETINIPKRVNYGSLPNIHEKFLSEELDFNFNNIKKSKYKTTDIIREQYFIDEEKKKRELASAKPVSNRDDLVQLTKQSPSEEVDQSDEIPPLIKVLTSSHDSKQRINECKTTVLAIAKRRKDFLDELKENVRDEPLCSQPSSIEKTFKNVTFRISDITLANFYFQSSFLLTSFPPIFNNYFGDLDDDTVAYLDRNLHIGSQIKEVYEQLLSTIDMNHCFRLDTDKYVVKCPDSLDLLVAQASSTLTKPYPEQIYNRSLSKKHEPPWADYSGDRQRWVLTPDPRRLEEEAEARKKRKLKSRSKGLSEPTVNLSLVPDPASIAAYKPRDPRQAREFQTWKDYWSQVYTEDDYLKYLSTQSTDYLHHIFHLHDRLPEDNRLSEENQVLLDERNRALREREAKISELRERKNKFEDGVWNAESIFLGGLGHEPVLNPEDDPIVQFEQDLERRKPKAKRIDLFDPVAHESALSSKQFLSSILNNVKHDNAQKRLEQIWKLLKMIDHDRLHMAVKYSTIEYEKKIEAALDAWESITQLIVRRENFIDDLENFERTASDANRFFESGPMGSSKMRLSESRRRTYLYNQLSILEKQITEHLKKIKKTFGDTVTYNGRNYVDKMQFDKLEMLHYLQEERRLNYLHAYASSGQHTKLDITFNNVL
ncbi:unnamed protein product [Rotaria magnacalcarata]|uniref:Uncharacterized protein n=10 Tax=Rotaria magnacalcarata TaxID=392030 RepID=A0A816MR85_9BILA|nr:unnamed protein product [Rotaria magnacalcarata]CAF4115613.1 unnamed protein product [Rotaria magnacalcarata]